MKTVLIGGGAGFIGSHLCDNLLKDDLQVICIDNLLTSDKKNIERFFKNPNFKFIQADITKDFSKEEFSNIDFIFDLASPASPNKNSPRSYINFPIETLLANSLGVKNLLDLAKEKKSKFLYVSSSEIYGDPLVTPQKEDYFGNVSPNGIRSVYDEGKRFGEAITMAYFRKFNLDIRIIRIFNTYGPWMQLDDGRVISNFINQAIKNKPITIYGNGNQTRSFCYVDDMVDGLKLAMFSEDTAGEVYNLGNPNEKTILEMANLIKQLTKSSSEMVFEDLPQDDPKIRRPDIEKAEKGFGFRPKISLEDGLLKTIEYFRSL